MAEVKELFSLDDSLTTVQDSWSSVPAGFRLLIPRIDTSTSSVLIGTGSRTFTLEGTGDRGWAASNQVVITDQSNSANSMTGTVTSYTSGTQTLVVDVTSVTGSGTLASWFIEDPSNAAILLIDDTFSLLIE